MAVGPQFIIIPIVIYVVVLAVIAGLLYLVLRFAIRDGLRAHQRWLDRREAAPSRAPEP